MNEALLVGGCIELAKMALMIWFQASSMAGLSEDEKDLIHDQVKAKFLSRDPARLPLI